MEKKRTSIVRDTINTAVGSAANSKYCINCQFSYIREHDGNGYCKFHEEGKDHGIHLKPIVEFGVCGHWEKKK